MQLDVTMASPEYRDREAVINSDYDMLGRLQGISGESIVRAAGDTAICDDFALTPGARADKRHGPRGAVYSFAYRRPNGEVEFKTTDFWPYDDENPGVAPRDHQAISEVVGRAVAQKEVPSVATAMLAQVLTIQETFLPYDSRPIFGVGTEVRVLRDDSTYVSLLVPRYLRKAPQHVSAYVRGMKEQGRQGDLLEGIEDLAYTSDSKKAARLIALGTMRHILAVNAERQKIAEN